MKLCRNLHGEKINLIIIMANKTVLFWTEEEDGCGMTWVATWIIFTGFVKVVSVFRPTKTDFIYFRINTYLLHTKFLSVALINSYNIILYFFRTIDVRQS